LSVRNSKMSGLVAPICSQDLLVLEDRSLWSARARYLRLSAGGLGEAVGLSPVTWLAILSQRMILRASVGHTCVSSRNGVRRTGHIDLRAQAEVPSVLRTGTPDARFRA